MRTLLIGFLILTFVGPLSLLLTGKIDFNADWRTANRTSSHIAPLANQTPEAIIQIYSARTFNWRGIFAVHTWIAAKPKNAKDYVVYQVVGWRLLRNLPPLMAESDIADRYWFNEKPTVILDIRGNEAEKLIPEIAKAAAHYPFPKEYIYWPGPNSNTFTAYIARQVPSLQLSLPSNAIGKDYLPQNTFFTHAPSGTGYQFSLYGLAGMTLAWREGIEINLLGLVYGISFHPFTIKLPGLGNQTFSKQAATGENDRR